MLEGYAPAVERYDRTAGWFRRCGQSGLMLPAVSLGCWHNFGAPDPLTAGRRDEADFHENCRRMLFTAFDLGITHFDLANNYGPPPGSAESRVGRILREDLRSHRDEIILSTKAGYRMWPGPYGEWGSRKAMLASLDQSLRRLGVDYVDIFYSHRPDPDTPIEETLGALDQAVRSGKALYAGISNYAGASTRRALETASARGSALPVIHQPAYSLLRRGPETDLFPVAEALGLGIIAFSPLAQGLLTGKYLQGIPPDSRAATGSPFLRPDRLTEEVLSPVRQLQSLAAARGQSLTQFALAWVLRHARVTSVLIGASRPEQIAENVVAAENTAFTGAECAAIDAIVPAPVPASG